MCCCYNIFFFWKLLDFMRNMSGRGMWQCVIVPNWQRYSARPFQIFVVQIYVPYTFAFSFQIQIRKIHQLTSFISDLNF